MALKKLKSLYSSKSSKKSSSSGTNLNKQVANYKTRLEASGQSTDTRNILQKALNLDKDMGFLAGLGDVLERGTGLASIKAMLANKDYKKSALQNAWEGFTGQQRYTGTEVLDSLSPSFKYAPNAVRFVGGLTTDILLDPATYITLGASALSKQAVSKGAKAVSSLDDLGSLAKTLKSTKTIDQASKLAKSTDLAQELLEASKLYRTADTLDTIANPLKLVGKGLKSAGTKGMQALERYAPDTATGLKQLGKQVQKTFDYKNFLKKHLGEKNYDDIRKAEAVADTYTEALASGSAKQQVLLEKVRDRIKKNPSQEFDIITKAGKRKKFSFAGMSDEQIMKELNKFAINQVYFDRPTVVDEQTLNNLIRSNGRVMLPVKKFANKADADEYVDLLKKFVDDPATVSLTKYTQRGTNNKLGYVLDIGSDNAKKLEKKISGMPELLEKANKAVEKSNLTSEKVQGKITTLTEKIQTNTKKLDTINKKLENINLSDTVRDKLITQRNKLNQTITNLNNNLTRVENTSLVRSMAGAERASANLADVKNVYSNLEGLTKTRELVPFDSPILDVPEMKEIANIQKLSTDKGLGILNTAGGNVNKLDKYEQYVSKQVLPDAKAYLQKHNAKKNPTIAYLVNATDHIPSQATSSVYGNFSPIEANEMIGADIFDSNIVGSNLGLAKMVRRKSYNTEVAKSLFTNESDWVRDINKLSTADVSDLMKAGFSKENGSAIAKRLGLSELIGTDETNKILKQLKGKNFLVSPDAIEMFDRAKKMYGQMDNAFLQQLNKFMKYWKGGNLLSVGYHLRNIFGAQANMALAGMDLNDIAKYTAQAGIDMNKFNSKLLPQFENWLLNPSNAQIFKTGSVDDITKALSKTMGEKDANLFMELLQTQTEGIWGSVVGQHDAVKRALGEMPKSKLGKVAGKIQDINYKLGSTADDINRIATYRWAQKAENANKLMKVGAKNAKDFVNYAMFDFKAMSPTEQMYFTKLFPFYNFIKNNLSFQLSNMMKNSQRYGTLSKAYKNLYSAQELTDKDVQQYVKDQLYIPIRKANGDVYVIKVSPPVQDATNLLSLENLLGATNPILQYITDRAYDKDLYTGKTLSEDRTANVQQLTDLLPYGRVARTALENPLSILLPVSKTSVTKAQNQNAYNELEELEKLAKEYKKRTGKSLPTLKELGL